MTIEKWFNVLPKRGTSYWYDAQLLSEFVQPLGLQIVPEATWQGQLYKPFQDQPLKFDWYIMESSTPDLLLSRVEKEKKYYAHLGREYPLDWVEKYDHKAMQRLAMQTYVEKNPLDWESEQAFWKSVDTLATALAHIRQFISNFYKAA